MRWGHKESLMYRGLWHDGGTLTWRGTSDMMGASDIKGDSDVKGVFWCDEGTSDLITKLEDLRRSWHIQDHWQVRKSGNPVDHLWNSESVGKLCQITFTEPSAFRSVVPFASFLLSRKSHAVLYLVSIITEQTLCSYFQWHSLHFMWIQASRARLLDKQC